MLVNFVSKKMCQVHSIQQSSGNIEKKSKTTVQRCMRESHADDEVGAMNLTNRRLNNLQKGTDDTSFIIDNLSLDSLYGVTICAIKVYFYIFFCKCNVFVVDQGCGCIVVYIFILHNFGHFIYDIYRNCRRFRLFLSQRRNANIEKLISSSIRVRRET